MKPVAISSLVCGIVSFLFCPIVFGILGIVLACISMKDEEARPTAVVGLWVSIIGMIAGLLISFLVFGAMMSSMPPIPT